MTTLFLPRLARADTFYVAPNGSASAPGTAAQPWSLDKANTSAKAGDTIVLLDGNYQTSIAPASNGSANAPITYRAQTKHKATLSNWKNGDPAVLLTNRSYIVVEGIRSESVNRWIYAIGGQHHITIRDCYFRDARGWESARFRGSGDRITITGCHFERGSDSLHIREGSYHLVENNSFVDASHTSLVLMGVHRSVVRRNTLRNDGQKCMEVFSMRQVYSPPRKSEHNVIEENVFGPCVNNKKKSSGIQYAGNKSILRRNVFRDSTVGMNWAHYGGKDGGDDPEAWWTEHNRFYNNVVYGCAQGVQVHVLFRTVNKGGSFSDNVMLNNIVVGKTSKQLVIDWDAIPSDITFINNTIRSTLGQNVFWWLDKPGATEDHEKYLTLAEIEAGYSKYYANNSQHAPLFVDAASGDFNLQAGSKCIDAAAPLTRTTAAGSGKKVGVVDALFFSDGFGIVAPDVVYVGKVRVKIVSVDYQANQLTLDRSISWAAGAGVFTDYAGVGPDVGAFESSPPAGDSLSPDLGGPRDASTHDASMGDGSGSADGAASDAGSAPRDGIDDGCRCSTNASAGGDGLLLLAALLLLWWRRPSATRRRR